MPAPNVRYESKADVNQRHIYLPYIWSAKRYSINLKIEHKRELEMSFYIFLLVGIYLNVKGSRNNMSNTKPYWT